MKPHEEFVNAVVKLINDKDLQKSVMSGADKRDYKKLKEDAAADRVKASKELAEAQKKRQVLEAEGRNTAARIEREAGVEIDKKTASLDAREEKVAAKVEKLGAMESALKEREQAVSQLEKEKRQAEKILAEGRALKEKYEAKIADLGKAGVTFG